MSEERAIKKCRLTEGAQDCDFGLESTSLKGYKEVQSHSSNGNSDAKNTVPDVVTIPPLEENQHGAGAMIYILHDTVSAETHTGEFSKEAPTDAYIRDLSLHMDSMEQSCPLTNDVPTAKKDSCVLAINLQLEGSGDKESATNVVDNNVGSAEGFVSTCIKVPSSDSFHFSIGSVNMAAERTFAHSTKKKLLVLDVNGLLADITYVPYDYDPDHILCKKAIFKRPYLSDFLKFCFERFEVGVWSSRTKKNMDPILDYLLGNDKDKVLFRWDQTYCTKTSFPTVEKRRKPIILKKLKMLWEKREPDLPWERGVYNESNTLLIDDSPYKALCNPQHTAIFPYTYLFYHVRDDALGPGGALRTYLEQLAKAENVQEFVRQNPFGQRAITERNVSWRYYLKVIEACSTPPRDTDEGTSAERKRVYRGYW